MIDKNKKIKEFNELVERGDMKAADKIAKEAGFLEQTGNQDFEFAIFKLAIAFSLGLSTEQDSKRGAQIMGALADLGCNPAIELMGRGE